MNSVNQFQQQATSCIIRMWEVDLVSFVVRHVVETHKTTQGCFRALHAKRQRYT